jgi:hypothetical protein
MPLWAAGREHTAFALHARSFPSGFSRGRATRVGGLAHGFTWQQVGPIDIDAWDAPARAERRPFWVCLIGPNTYIEVVR